MTTTETVGVGAVSAGAASGEATRPLSALRALVRANAGPDGARLAGPALLEAQAALRQCADPLDLEAAGALLHRAGVAPTADLRPERVAVLGSSTLDALPNLLTAVLVRDGIAPSIRAAGFNQWRLEIMGGAPTLGGFEPGLVVCLLDDTAVFERVADPLELGEVETACAAFPVELRRWADACERVLGGLVVLSTIPLSPARRARVISLAGRARLEAAWLRMNAAICDLAGDGRTVVLSQPADRQPDGRQPGAPAAVFASDRMRHVAGHAYTPEYLRGYAEQVATVVRARFGLARKCLVLDLDNTLWGGVVGDEGVAALRLGGAYPGCAHQELQALARDLAAQGVVLAVASKNDDALAREAIATHPEMVLAADSFAAVRANWDPKPGNVAALAAELNLGVDALVFVDDNPAERGLMRHSLPQVRTHELPPDPAAYAASLAAADYFTLLEVTDADRDRGRMYQANSRRAELARTAATVEEYLLELGCELTVGSVGSLEAARAAQLFAKTNQFNLTGVRYPRGEIEAPAPGRRFFVARLTDRFGDNGVIAALAVDRAAAGGPATGPGARWSIDNMVLSCRVFARNVEQAIVGQLLRAAAGAGASAVTAAYAPSARNGAFAEFYPALGFVPDPETEAGPVAGAGAPRRFRHDLATLPDLPAWITFPHGPEVFW